MKKFITIAILIGLTTIGVSFLTKVMFPLISSRLAVIEILLMVAAMLYHRRRFLKSEKEREELLTFDFENETPIQ